MFNSLKEVVNLLAFITTQTISERCSSFTFGSDNTDLISSTYFEAGARVSVSNLFETIDTNDLPAFCRIEVKITTNTTANSTAATEIWLPEKWNGRLLTIGNGGFAGGVAVADLAVMAVKQGFAGVSTDLGHSSSQSDSTWALGNDNAIIDFGWRAMHLSVVTGKQIVQKFYGQSHKKAYFIGCSQGGLQGLKEVQMFPDDFDGVVVGSPPNWYTHVVSGLIRDSLNVHPTTSPYWIPENTWTNVIHPEVLRQCDELDGIKDGVISNPLICSFRPETLACRMTQDPESCLTISQIEVLHKTFSDYYDANQTYISGGFYPGSEINLPQSVLGAQPEFGSDFFRFFILNDTTWQPDQFDIGTIALADRINPGRINANNPDLQQFASNGGKLVYYVGWAENVISPGVALHYYETVNSFMRAHTNLEMDDFYRVFMVPGMAHCFVSFFWLMQVTILHCNLTSKQLGDGANAFGGIFQEVSDMPPLAHDANHDVLQALIHWVENDIAPENITAVHYKNNNATEGVAFTRPICKYPTSPRYVRGDSNDADSFSCS